MFLSISVCRRVDRLRLPVPDHRALRHHRHPGAGTSNVAEYYVAGRRIPAVFNGMATGADWMSAASFIGLAGTLYLTGYQGLAYVMGWTGGFVLVAPLLAPYLRRFGQYTIPDFLGGRAMAATSRAWSVSPPPYSVPGKCCCPDLRRWLDHQSLRRPAVRDRVPVGLAGILVCSFPAECAR